MPRAADVVTLGRALVALPVAWLLRRRSSDADRLAGALFLAGALSDYLDGSLARARGAGTALGQDLDPLADKLLVDAALCVLAARGRFPAPAAAVVIARDVAVSLRRARTELAPSRLARWKTGLLYAGVTGLIVGRDGSTLRRAGAACTAFAVALSVVSAADYFTPRSRDSRSLRAR